MKFLYFTDTHIRGSNPKNRLDNFQDTLEKKFEEVVEISQREEVDYVLHGGDLFDRPDTSVSIINRFARVLKKIEVPIYIISGNHDIYGHNPDTINRTMLGLLDTIDILNIIDNEIVILEKNGVRVQLSGQPYIFNIDGPDKLKYYSPREIDPSVDFSIHMVHGMLLEKIFFEGVDYTLIDNIVDTKADVILSGHYHSGYNTLNINGKYFINPGSLVRITNSLSEMKRRPKVVIIEVSKEEINFKEIYLKTALNGEEVLDREAIEKFVFKSERIYEFKQMIDEAIDFEKMDINEVLMEVSISEGVPEEVRKEALKRIANIQMRGMEGD